MENPCHRTNVLSVKAEGALVYEEEKVLCGRVSSMDM